MFNFNARNGMIKRIVTVYLESFSFRGYILIIILSKAVNFAVGHEIFMSVIDFFGRFYRPFVYKLDKVAINSGNFLQSIKNSCIIGI